MSLSKMVHNDLHSNNIYVEKMNKPISITYIFSNNSGKEVKYVLTNQMYKIYVYDFDRAYCERLGENVVLNLKCDISSQCNLYIENKDMLKILCSITRRMPHFPTNMGFVPFITNNINLQKYWHDIFTWKKTKKDMSKCRLRNSNHITADIGKYQGCFNSTTILHNFATYMSKHNFNLKINSKTTGNVYRALNSNFNLDGSINRASYDNINKFRSDYNFEDVLEKVNNYIPTIIEDVNNYLNNITYDNFLEKYINYISLKLYSLLYYSFVTNIKRNKLKCNLNNLNSILMINLKVEIKNKIQNDIDGGILIEINNIIIKKLIKKIKKIVYKYYNNNLYDVDLIYKLIKKELKEHIITLKNKLTNKLIKNFKKELNTLILLKKSYLITNVVNKTTTEICKLKLFLLFLLIFLIINGQL